METVTKRNEEICALDSSKHQDECSEPPKKIAKSETEPYSRSDIINPNDFRDTIILHNENMYPDLIKFLLATLAEHDHQEINDLL